MSDTDNAWQEVSEKFSALGRTFKQRYEERGEGTEPTEGDVTAGAPPDMKRAMDNVGDSIERVFGTIGDSLQDDGVKDQARSAFSSLVEALGSTFSELGDEVRRMGQRETEDDETAREHVTVTDDAPPSEDFEPEGIKELREDLEGE